MLDFLPRVFIIAHMLMCSNINNCRIRLVYRSKFLDQNWLVTLLYKLSLIRIQNVLNGLPVMVPRGRMPRL
jgi:hypothetical protein